MSSEVAKRIYIGGGESGLRRLKNIKELARKYFDGSVSALFNDAVDRVYGLHKKTGAIIPGKAKRMD